MDTFVTAYDENIRPIMDKIDRVRPLLSHSHDSIIFPNVVVVGDQSSGKSTLLEALSLVELPKGNGLVTRCPLIIRLRKSNERKVYRVYDGNRKVLLDEANLNMPEYIEEATKELAGNNKNIVETVIELQIEDPHVRDLTVVDLPGIVRIPIGNQPEDIGEQTKSLISKYISQKGCVILCVFPANMDIATVESISLARQVDRLGKRTIGVITKSDLAAKNEVLVQLLSMDKHDITRLKLGFVAVRNRSTDENISLKDAREREKEFFRQHPAANVVNENCLGIDALINRLATLYSQRVKETFPKMREDIQDRLRNVEDELSKLPLEFQTSAARLAAYNQLVDVYVEKVLKAELMGLTDNEHSSVLNILHQRFIEYQNKVREQRKELFSPAHKTNVQQVLTRRLGQELPNFLSSSILKKFICEKLNQLWNVTDELIDDCFGKAITQLSKGNENACKNNLLLSKIINVFHHTTVSYMNQTKATARSELRAMLELDQNDPYTINTYYMDLIEKCQQPSAPNSFGSAPTALPKIKVLGDDDDAELTFKAVSTDDQSSKLMLYSIYSYWHTLNKRFIDYVTLCLRARCVFGVCANIQQSLRCIAVTRCDLIDACLTDDAVTRFRRKQLQEEKSRLETAYAILHKDDDAASIDDYVFSDFKPTEDHLSMNSKSKSKQSQSAVHNDVIDYHTTQSGNTLLLPQQTDQQPITASTQPTFQFDQTTPTFNFTSPTASLPSPFGSGFAKFK